MELEKSEKEEAPSVVDSFEQLKDVVKRSGVDEVEIANLNVAGLQVCVSCDMMVDVSDIFLNCTKSASFVVVFLQVLVNDLLTRVEMNNEELMALLQERDQLHMEQDSMLVDIEDLIKQCKRQAELNNRRPVSK